jgi:hypothetical protein
MSRGAKGLVRRGGNLRLPSNPLGVMAVGLMGVAPTSNFNPGVVDLPVLLPGRLEANILSAPSASDGTEAALLTLSLFMLLISKSDTLASSSSSASAGSLSSRTIFSHGNMDKMKLITMPIIKTTAIHREMKATITRDVRTEKESNQGIPPVCVITYWG